MLIIVFCFLFFPKLIKKFTYKNAAKKIAKKKENNWNKIVIRQRYCKLYAAKLICMWKAKHYFVRVVLVWWLFQTLSWS